MWNVDRNGARANGCHSSTSWEELCFGIPAMLSALGSFFFPFSQTLRSRLEISVTSAELWLRQQDTSQSATGDLACRGAWARLTTREREPARRRLLLLGADCYGKLYKTNSVRRVFCLLFLPIYIFFLSSFESWRWTTSHIFIQFSNIFSNFCLNIHTGNYMNTF